MGTYVYVYLGLKSVCPVCRLKKYLLKYFSWGGWVLDFLNFFIYKPNLNNNDRWDGFNFINQSEPKKILKDYFMYLLNIIFQSTYPVFRKI